MSFFRFENTFGEGIVEEEGFGRCPVVASYILPPSFLTAESVSVNQRTWIDRR